MQYNIEANLQQNEVNFMNITTKLVMSTDNSERARKKAHTIVLNV